MRESTSHQELPRTLCACRFHSPVNALTEADYLRPSLADEILSRENISGQAWLTKRDRLFVLPFELS